MHDRYSKVDVESAREWMKKALPKIQPGKPEAKSGKSKPKAKARGP